MNIQNDFRRVNWHVDRYARNLRRGDFRFEKNVYPFGIVMHKLTHDEPIGWPDREMMEEAWEDERLALSYMGFVHTDSYSLARNWFTDLRGDKWARYEIKPKQAICPNLSLTRYDWQPNAVPKYYRMGLKRSHSLPDSAYCQYGDQLPTQHRIPKLFGIEYSDYYTPRNDSPYEPHYLTKRVCGRFFHGPSTDFTIPFVWTGSKN